MALEFYENGKKLVAYRVKDLVAEPEKLPHSVSHFTWKAEAEFNEEKKELYLRTLNDEEYLFDVTTGCVIEGTLTRSIPRCPQASYATRTPAITHLPSLNQDGKEESDSRQFSEGIYLFTGVIVLIILIAVSIFIYRRIIQPRKRA